ncbi:hypothetical protein Peur_070521 [Populus x canadensis]
MACLSSSLEVCGSTEPLVGNNSNKDLDLAQLEDIEMKIEAVAGRCSIDNVYQKTGAAQLEIPVSDKSACDSDTLTEDQEYMKEIKEPHAYLDMVNFLPSGN